MRILFVGAGATAVTTAQQLLEHGHEVVIIEKNENRIREVSENLDCGFLCGDGTRPHILRQADPEATDILLCLTDMDQENILASLVGQALKIPHVITKLENPEFEAVATALGLETIAVPVRTVSRRLADMVEGKETLELSSLIKDDARLFSILVQPHQAGLVRQLGLPEEAMIVWLYRNGKLKFSDPDMKLKEGDEAVILTRDDIASEVHDYLIAPPEMTP